MRVRPLGRGPSPSLAAAVALAIGTWAGAGSVGQEAAAAAGAALAAYLSVRTVGTLKRLSVALCFLFAGFVSGRVRIASPSVLVFRSGAELDLAVPVTVAGRLADFWTTRGAARRSRIEIRRVRQEGRDLQFPAEAALWLSGDAEPGASRGDELEVTGLLSSRDIPVSTRDLAKPFPEYSFSVKSAMQFSRRRTSALSWFYRPNEYLARRLSAQRLPRDEIEAPVEALLLGRTGELDDGTTREFRRGGLYHLLVISGLHVGLLVTFAALLLKPIALGRKSKDAILLFVGLLFALATGASAPAVRAALMLSIFLLSRILEKPVSPLQAAGLSAIAIVAISPKELWSAGFFLTYAAVGGIAILAEPLRETLRALPGWLGSTYAIAVSAQLATAPLLFWRFNLVNPLAWVLSPLVVLLLGFLMAAGIAILFAAVLGLPVAPPSAAFQLAERILSRLAERSSGLAIAVPTPPLSLALLLLLLLLLSARGRGAAKWLAAAGFALLFAFLALRRPGRLSGPAFSVEALDVGQGDSILLRSEGGAFLVDGGGSFDPSAEDFGRTRLLPKLGDRGIVQLDGVMLSHSHPDHALGLFAVLRELPVESFFRGEGTDENGFCARLESIARARGVRVVELSPGREVPWRGGTFTVLRSGGAPFKADPVNNGSLVVLFQKGTRRVLLTGDAGAPAERELLVGGTERLRADILKVGHHGSRTSSLPEFVAAVSPRAAIVSCGRNNRFHHPSPTTLATFRSLRVPLFRTDQLSDSGFLVLPDRLILFERGVR